MLADLENVGLKSKKLIVYLQQKPVHLSILPLRGTGQANSLSLKGKLLCGRIYCSGT
jgi:hypothetical protein